MADTIIDPTAQGAVAAPNTDTMIAEKPIEIPAWPVAPPPGYQADPPQTVEKVDTTPPAAPVAPAAPPAWIDNVGAPAAPPQYAAPPPEYAPPPQYQAPPGQFPPQEVGGISPQDRALYELVNRPEDWVRGMARTEVQNIVAPVYNQVNQAASQLSGFLKDQADTQEAVAKTNVKNLYANVINQDEDYNSNPIIKAEVDRTFQNLLGNSIQAARNGQFKDVSRMGALTPLEAQAAINAIKTVHGVPGTYTGGPQVGSAVVERTTAPVPEDSVEITPDEEAAIAWRSRVEPDFRSKLIAAKKEAIRLGDWQF